ncbi:MAG TPA: sugar phosphate isomerase/epimerase [Myxococcales bacterium]|nr:sugar phosphate isomerase/epimerase [Myxococcales bacterium]
MKLAMSAIAWDPPDDEAAARILREHAFTGVELAPTKIFARPDTATDAEVASCRRWWEARGLRVVALQALLFGRPDLTIFADTQEATLEYLARVVRLGSRLGAGVLVFGSPRNRARGSLPMAEAWPRAVEFFRRLGAAAAEAGTCVCIEPNPPRYGADFIVDSHEAVRLVEEVGSPGFGLHLDAACAQLAGEDFPARLRASARVLRHVHLSEPELAPVGAGGSVDLPATAAALRDISYGGFVSVEMKPAGLDALRGAAKFAGQLAVPA